MRKKLYMFRAGLMLSQAKMAKKIGCCRMTYADVENGKREPSLKFCWAFERAFAIPLSEVVDMMKVDIEAEEKTDEQKSL